MSTKKVIVLRGCMGPGGKKLAADPDEVFELPSGVALDLAAMGKVKIVGGDKEPEQAKGEAIPAGAPKEGQPENAANVSRETSTADTPADAKPAGKKK